MITVSQTPCELLWWKLIVKPFPVNGWLIVKFFSKPNNSRPGDIKAACKAIKFVRCNS